MANSITIFGKTINVVRKTAYKVIARNVHNGELFTIIHKCGVYELHYPFGGGMVIKDKKEAWKAFLKLVTE